MLVQQLKINDLNNEKMSKFDGTMVYAQNKRQQVLLIFDSIVILDCLTSLMSSNEIWVLIGT